MLIIKKDTALDLSVKGSVGRFEVPAKEGKHTSINVQYIQTHVGFALDGQAEEKLLQNLRPVREVFEISELEFDELMQRDIDDGRVSSELIPYLLDQHAKVLVKLFPPIIGVVLPTNEHGRPAQSYPKTEHLVDKDQENDVEWSITRSGDIGAEAFEFRQLRQAGEDLEHDYAQLRVNTSKCKLVIVDGQHRAMALLALYRNVKGWPADSKKFEEYYGRWARSEIQNFDLSRIHLPVMLLTFPQLDGSETNQPKVTEACRAVFLALNKNARPVSRARNYLLDDSDIIAQFLRTTLQHIKAQDDVSELAIRIWNIELDAQGDRRKLANAVAVTGVMHLYTAIEFLMLNKQPLSYNSLSPRRQNFWKQKDLTDCIRRLHAKPELGEDRSQAARRFHCDEATTEVLAQRFAETYGSSIIELLDKLAPYRSAIDAASALEKQLKVEAFGAMPHTILYEGQGQSQVFEDYVETLASSRREFEELQRPVPPSLETSYTFFEGRKKELEEIRKNFRDDRNSRYGALQPKHVASFRESVSDLFANTFTTEAFQVALLICFWDAAEAATDEAEDAGEHVADDQLRSWLAHYVDALNSFLKCNNLNDLKRVLNTFYGEVNKNTDGSYSVARSSRTLRRILISGELKPEEWPKFRYVFLELWGAQPQESFPSHYVYEHVQKHVRGLRALVLRNFEERELKQEAEKLGVLSSELPEETKSETIRQCQKSFAHALRKLGSEVNLAQLQKERISPDPEPTEEEILEIDDDFAS